MRISKFALVVAFVLTAILFAEVAAHADETDQATKLTFSKPIATPGRVPSAGSDQLAQDRQQTIAANQTAEAGD